MKEFIVAICILVLSFYFGALYEKNRQEIDRVTLNGYVTSLKVQIQNDIDVHTKAQLKLSKEIEDAEIQYNEAITDIVVNTNQRLLKSEERANIYRSKAIRGEAECRGLADHAAELDRSLTEGRELVKQLTSTVRKRDLEIQQISNYFMNDRNLLNERYVPASRK